MRFSRRGRGDDAAGFGLDDIVAEGGEGRGVDEAAGLVGEVVFFVGEEDGGVAGGEVFGRHGGAAFFGFDGV